MPLLIIHAPINYMYYYVLVWVIGSQHVVIWVWLVCVGVACSMLEVLTS